MVLELNGLIDYIKTIEGVAVIKAKTEILTEGKVKVCVTCAYDLISNSLSDFNDFKLMGIGSAMGNNHEVFFQYRPI